MRTGDILTRLPELLAPARDREAFLAALAAGADAIYCGVAGGLNARRKAAGISEGELAELCALAHARGARVYVTTNVVVKQCELVGAVAAVARYAATGVDAFIIQDWGLLAEVRRTLPDAEIHVSTQANVHDARGVRLCEELGAARVTLSRELSLGELVHIGRFSSAELEIFAHGAICPSYSGVCMLSSFLRKGRSPNRGLCAQPCRLPFDLVDERGTRLQAAERERPLCTHDNCAIDDIPQLREAGVASLKLEGRMKPAAYVYTVAHAWREALDKNAPEQGSRDEKPPSCIDGCGAGGPGAECREAGAPEAARIRRALKRSFNRGLTDAYLHGRSGNELMSYERSGNRGELVGEVIGFEPEPGIVPRDGQQMRGAALVRLTAPVGAGDSVELRPPANPARFLVVESPRSAQAGDTLRLSVPRPMPVGAEARVTKSAELERAAARAIAAEEAAAEAARAGLAMTGSRAATSTGRDAGNRADACALVNSTCASTVASASCMSLALASVRVPATGSLPTGASGSLAPEICALTTSIEDAEPLRAAGANRVYLDVIDAEPTPENLERARAASVIPVLDEVCRELDHARIDPWIAPGMPVAVGNVSELALACELGALPELRDCIPVHNASALDLLAGLSAHGAWLSPELAMDEIRELAASTLVPLGIMAFGRPRLMTCEHCVLQVAYDCDRNHAACPHRRARHWLVNIDGRRLPTRTDARGRSRVYLDEPIDLASRATELAAAGVRRLLVDATTLSLTEATQAISRISAALARESVGVRGTFGLIDGGVA